MRLPGQDQQGDPEGQEPPALAPWRELGSPSLPQRRASACHVLLTGLSSFGLWGAHLC